MSGAIPLLNYTLSKRVKGQVIKFLSSLILHDLRTRTVNVLNLTTSGEAKKIGQLPETWCPLYLYIKIRFLQLEVIFLAPRLASLLNVRYGVYFDEILVNQLVQILLGTNNHTQCFS